MPHRNGRQIIERVLLTPSRLARLLEKAKVRVTEARMDVLACLVAADRPLTHHEIAARLPQYDASTVFRGLTEFAAAEIVWRIETGESDRFFEIADFRYDGEPAVRHPYFYCVKCGELRCLREVSVQQSVAVLAGASDIEATDMLIKGRCRVCRPQA
ncbi:Fur family transcriptional regulator [Blastopirellula retiformator]|uniref:Ferric uptake regulator family protein n=1 Tax=Blastopirellula retiformator TaxID=2527970 RepID=A0A5C5V7R9_9BACT|nr:transcriptional repressor [Blastopirellula retiformator]TWT34608.1 Ferric uptake regulator family protein [Blastopirellula retiformator]